VLEILGRPVQRYGWRWGPPVEINMMVTVLLPDLNSGSGIKEPTRSTGKIHRKPTMFSV